MAKAPLSFPGSAADLPKLSNADLIQLVKQEGIDHPQGKSLAHFMSKEDKVAYLAAQHYKTGADIAHIVPAAEGKYADFLAKAKAKNEAEKVATGANCSATAMKELESTVAQIAAGNLSQLDIIHGDITSWFIEHPAPLSEAVNGGTMQQFISQIKSLPSSVLLGPQEELANTLVETLKVARNAIDDFHSPTLAADASKMLGHAAKVDDVVPIYGADPIGSGLQTISAGLKSQAEGAAQDYLVSSAPMQAFVQVGGDFSKDSLGGLISTLNDLSSMNPTQLTAKLTQDLDVVVKQLADEIASKLSQFAAENLHPATLEKVVAYTENVPVKLLGDSGKAALQELHDLALDKASSTAWQAEKAAFEGLNNVELKQLAYKELENHGYQKSLGSFLTKDEKVELLAKFKAQQPVDDLAAKAKEKYLIKEGKLPAKEVESVSVKADEVKAAEAVVDPTKAEFNLADYLGGSGEEHLAPTEANIPFETEPHPAPNVTHVFTPTGERPGGGSHQMEIFVDENGDKWLFKVQPVWQSQVEDFAAQVGEKLGLDVTELRLETNVSTSFYGKVDGSFQRMLPSKGELGKEGEAITKLTAEQVKDVQRQQVYDWLISNHDSHGENFLVGLDGHLIPIDKGQSMKFFGNDLLSPTYSPNPSNPVYNNVWARVIKGDLKVDFNAIDEMLTRVEQIPSKEYEALLREQLAAKYETAGRKLNAFLPPEMRDFENFVQAAVERKETIRADFEAFYKDIANRAGIKWQPSWAEGVVKAEKIADPALKLAVQGDIATPIDQSLAQAIADTHSAGKAIHLAGEEINQGQALVWQETDIDGSKILRMEVRLETQADARLTATFEDAAGTSMAQVNAVGASAQATGDTAFDAIQGAAKTVNHHATDGEYNQAKIDQMLKVNEQLFKTIDLADAADAKLAKGEIDVAEWAQAKADGEKAVHYKQVINDIQDGIAYQHKVEHVAKFDVEKAKAEWLTKAPAEKAPVPTPTLSEPVKLFEHPPLLVTESVRTTDAGPGYMERVRNGGTREPDVSTSYSPAGEVRMTYGKMFEGTMKVEGSEVRTTWSGWNMTSNYPGKSTLRFELKGWDGTQAGIEKLMSAMDRLGVDSHLATVEEEKLTYWQMVTGQMKQSVEYARPNEATGSYKGMRETIDRIEARIGKEAMDTRAKIEVYREEMAKQFGQEAVDRAPERIAHVHDLKGREIGFGHFERFDLPTDLRPYFDQGGKQWGIARKANLSKDTFTESWGSTGNGEKIRLGMQKAGTSAEADLGSGGGTGSFSSMGINHWQSNGPMAIINPSSVMRRASSYNAANDNFGQIGERVAKNYLDPAKWDRYIGTSLQSGTKELVARYGTSFYDDLELVMVHSQPERDAVIASFKELGVDTLRGIKIEDRIVVSTNGRMPGVIDKWFTQHPEAYTHSYTNPVDLVGGGKKASAVADAAGPLPEKVVLVTTGAPGSLLAQKQAYENAITDWPASTNSVKAKLDDLAAKLTAAGTKTTSAAMKDQFAAWWQETGQYKGLSQVKATKSFMAFKAKETEVHAAIEGLAAPADKITAMAKFSNTPAKQGVLEDVFGKPFTEIVEQYKADPATSGGAFGSGFNDWLVKESLKLDNALPQGFYTIDGWGDIPTNVLKQMVDAAKTESVSTATDIMAKHFGAEWDVAVGKLNELKAEFGFDGQGSITKTYEKMLQLAQAPVEKVANAAYATVPALGDIDVTVANKLAELLHDAGVGTDSPLPIHVQDVANAVGLDKNTVQIVLDQAASEYGLVGKGWDTVVQEWLHDAEQGGVKATFEASAPSADVVAKLPGIGDVTKAQVDKIHELAADGNLSANEKIKQLATALGKEPGDIVADLVKAKDEFGMSGAQGMNDVLNGFTKLTTPKVEPATGPFAAPHPGFVAQPAPASTGYAYDIVTPLGKMNGDVMNDLTDAAWEIEHQGTNVIDAMHAVEAKLDQSYGDMLPTLDAYAKDKGLGGFPGPNPADVLKAFVDDTSKAVSKLITETKEQQPVTYLLHPKNASLPPLPSWQSTVLSDVGKPVTPPDAAEKIFQYNVMGEKVPVVFVKADVGGTNVLVQEKGTGQWFLLKNTSTGKTTKDEIIELLHKVQHSSIEPF